MLASCGGVETFLACADTNVEDIPLGQSQGSKNGKSMCEGIGIAQKSCTVVQVRVCTSLCHMFWRVYDSCLHKHYAVFGQDLSISHQIELHALKFLNCHFERNGMPEYVVRRNVGHHGHLVSSPGMWRALGLMRARCGHSGYH